MVCLVSVILTFSAGVGDLAAPTLSADEVLNKRSTTTSTGTSNGYYYYFWTGGVGSVTG
jgi:endo-1,4-beta-xylanase